MTKYNIALLPATESDSEKFVQFSAVNFKDVADEYVLGAGSKPHISLCQFELDGEEQTRLEEIRGWLLTNIKLNIDVDFEPLSQKPGTGDFSENIWVELPTTKTVELLKLHNDIADFLMSIGISCKNPSRDKYQPHLTLAKIRNKEIKAVAMPDTIEGQMFRFSVQLGRTDNNWQYVKSLSVLEIEEKVTDDTLPYLIGKGVSGASRFWQRHQSLPIKKFQKAVSSYLNKEEMQDFVLSQAELIQLSWFENNQIVTPEQRKSLDEGDLNTEIKRAIARADCFELLLNPNLEQSYKRFVIDQPLDSRLSFEAFKSLADSAKQLTKDQQKIIRASCFLAKSIYFDTLLEQQGIRPPKDTEEFLSLIATQPSIFEQVPMIHALNESQQQSLKYVFWHHTHLRHMLFTEGGDNMFTVLRNGIKSGEIDQNNFALWSWRWLTNVMGFHGHQGKGAEFLDRFIFQDTMLLLEELNHLFKVPDYPVLENFLLKKAQRHGLDQDERIKGSEIHVVAHLMAFVPELIAGTRGNDIIDGYVAYRDNLSNKNASLAKGYQEFCANSEVQTPTYTPAILRSAYLLLKDKMKVDRPLKDATIFTCQVLDALHQQKLDHIVSCRNLAWVETLEPILEHWLVHKDVSFQLNEQNELEACHESSPSLKPF